MDIFESFCHDPCFRMTPSWDQNDPKEFAIKNTPAIKEAEERFGENARYDLKNYLNLHGIISLCNSLTIPYMWDKYGDEGRGVAVSIEIDEEKPFLIFSNSNDTGYSLTHDRGFLYSPVRYTDIPDEDLAYFSIDPFIETHLVTKEKHKWEVENETRFILPFDFLSKILATQRGKEKITRILCQHNIYPAKFKKSTLNGIHYKLDEAYMYCITIEALSAIWKSSKENDIMFFSRIDTGIPGTTHGTIKKITLGENADKERFFNILKRRDGPFSISDAFVGALSKKVSRVYQVNIEEKLFLKVNDP
ncbi:DUF2971 domain-containing protein [Chromohalobacter sarecensis]|uniref:DUF2971 domain-containing protein n=1 Tax=Chromohalobacter sarecensis TaxID=245294 RepID=A0ABV9CXB8_9GAMM|nr:DUF2971 domain-containing protein [Chromohalobacter sarecensis]MCK0716464.1 DUF2971 domain-containing protein [Chromohalobacter sarecensis]